jgi:hypothetical protein
MKDVSITQHAAIRLGQRAIAIEDIDLIMSLGTEVQDGYFMRDADARVAVDGLMRLVRRIERLPGKFAVVADGRVVTAYRANKRKQRRLMMRDRGASKG